MSTLDVSMADARDYLPLSPQQFQILLALSDADRHGYGIILEVAERTGGATRLGTGTLYTALAGLEERELVEESEAPARRMERSGSGGARPAGRGPSRRYYRLTPIGRAVLEAETARLDALVKQARRKGVTPLARPALGAASPSRSK